MSKADLIFKNMCEDIINTGTDTKGELVRPHWEDGTPAYTIKKFGVCNRYDLMEEFPALTFRKTAIKSCMDEILWIYQKKSNNIHDLNSHIWDEWADENGSIGKAYGYQVGKLYKHHKVDLSVTDISELKKMEKDYPSQSFLPKQPLESIINDEQVKSKVRYIFGKRKSDVPVLFLTALDDEINVVMGLDFGADDYISKPFRIRELMSRIRSVLRRYSREDNDNVIHITAGEIEIHLKENRVYKSKNEIMLTAMEYRLLLQLANHRGQVLTRNQLLEGIWDVSGDFVNDNTLTVYIKRLREKLENDNNNPTVIKTVRGMGYIIEK